MSMSRNATGLVRVLKALKEQDKEEAEKKAAGAYKVYSHVDLPKEEWYTCPSCGGSGSYLEQEDCHRSAGWAPCGRCGKSGQVTTKYVSEWVYPKVPYYG
jgi:transcription elongation factor Elf1